MSHIYDYIADMKARPGMYTKDKDLGQIETLLQGYVGCLWSNQITEDYEGRRFSPREFSKWLYKEFGWSGALGFSTAIHEHTPNNEAALDLFFDLVDRFRYATNA